jgi:hypothetical protein
MATPAASAGALASALRGSPVPDALAAPLGEFLGSGGGGGGGDINSPMQTPVVAFDSLSRGATYRSEGTAASSHNKTPIGMFEYTGSLDLCLGIIGAANRVCIKDWDSCHVGTHKANPALLDEGAVYIFCPGKPDSIYLTPSLGLLENSVPECVKEYLMQEKRSVKSHIQLFTSLPSEDDVLGGERQVLDVRVKEMIENEGGFSGRTPAKNKLGGTRLWTDTELIKKEVAMVAVDPLHVEFEAAMTKMTGAKEEDPQASSVTYLESVSEAFVTMEKMVQEQKATLKGYESGTNEMVGKSELGLVSLKAELGIRSKNNDSLPGLQIWDIVETLVEQMQSLNQRLDLSERARVNSMAPKSYQGIPRVRYISFSTILILNIKWPLADIFNLKNSTSSSENENTLPDPPKSVTNNRT